MIKAEFNLMKWMNGITIGGVLALHLIDEVEPALDMVQPLFDALEALVDLVEPLIDPLEPLVDLVPPLVAAGEARGRGTRLLFGGAGLLEGVVDLDQHRAHAAIYGS